MLTYRDNKLLYRTNNPNERIILKNIGGRWDSRYNAVSLPPIFSSICSVERVLGRVAYHASTAHYMEQYGFHIKPANLENVNATLYPYQKEAVDFLVNSPHHGSILSLSPGLGKTLTSIAAAVAMGAKKVLVVSPLTLMSTWIAEIYKWARIHAVNCYGGVPDGHGWFVTNYDTVVKYADQYIDQCYDVLIIDESILVKNRKTKRAQTVLALSNSADKVWLLSGAPVSRHADDLFMQLRIVAPTYFTSYWRFVNQYCLTHSNVWGTKVVGTNPNINFAHEFKDLMFVRNQKQVLPDLPDMLFQRYEVELTGRQAQLYTEMRDMFIMELLEDRVVAGTRLAQIVRLQQIVSCPETFENGLVSPKYDLLETLISNAELPLPAIVWVNFKQTADTLCARLARRFSGLSVAHIHGDVPAEERTRIIRGFQNGECDILILSLGTGKYGLTLTNAQGVVYYDKTFDGDAYLQSLARVQRIGLSHVPIVCTIQAKNSVDTLIEFNLAGKMQSIHQISNNDLATLMRSLT